ncbi:MAG: TolC family protein [Sphingobacteriales bacterium]|nr:MAG: TolC family protein [Sphingobacteriales bacterium]
MSFKFTAPIEKNIKTGTIVAGQKLLRHPAALLAAILFLLAAPVSAQDSTWTLADCLHYAQVHNLSLQEQEIDLRVARMNYQVSKLSHIPQLSLASSYGASFGRSINPTTNQFENTRFSSLGLGASSNVLLFGWFQKHYTIKNNGLSLEQAAQARQQSGNEVAMHVTTAYLRALLAKEQIANVRYQIDISREHKSRMERLLEAGRSNMLEVSQARTQLATDSGLYYSAMLHYEQALIELKAILNLDFTVTILPVPVKDYEPPFYSEKTDPETLYLQAAAQHPDLIRSGLGVNIATRELKIARAGSLPQLSTYYATGTNYSSSFYEMLPNGERQLMQLGRQLNNNLYHSFGLGISVPLFNGFTYKKAIRGAGYDIEKAKLAELVARQRLRQNIYTAYTDYELTLKQYFVAGSVAEHAKNSFHGAQVRFDNGLITHVEYLTEQNNFLKAQNEVTALKYDLQFKKIRLDCYRTGCGE